MCKKLRTCRLIWPTENTTAFQSDCAAGITVGKPRDPVEDPREYCIIMTVARVCRRCEWAAAGINWKNWRIGWICWRRVSSGREKWGLSTNSWQTSDPPPVVPVPPTGPPQLCLPAAADRAARSAVELFIAVTNGRRCRRRSPNYIGRVRGFTDKCISRNW